MFPFSALLLVRLLRFSFVNIEFLERKKLILNRAKRASHFVKIIVACPHHLPKMPKSTQRKQAIPNKGSLFYSHCAVYGIWIMVVRGKARGRNDHFYFDLRSDRRSLLKN
jgi:hypothetical protein